MKHFATKYAKAVSHCPDRASEIARSWKKYSGPSRICPRAAGSNLRWPAMRWVIGYELHRIRNDAFYSSLSGQAGFRAYSRQAREDRASIISGSASVMTTITADLDFASNFRLNRSFRHQIQARFIEERIPMRFWQKFKSALNPELKNSISSTRRAPLHLA